MDIVDPHQILMDDHHYYKPKLQENTLHTHKIILVQLGTRIQLRIEMAIRYSLINKGLANQGKSLGINN